MTKPVSRGLRIDLGALCRRLDQLIDPPLCDQEHVTGNFSRGSYYDEDLRTIRAEGVNHVMRLFLKHCVEHEVPRLALAAEIASVQAVLCDEEKIEQSAA